MLPKKVYKIRSEEGWFNGDYKKPTFKSKKGRIWHSLSEIQRFLLDVNLYEKRLDRTTITEKLKNCQVVEFSENEIAQTDNNILEKLYNRNILFKQYGASFMELLDKISQNEKYKGFKWCLCIESNNPDILRKNVRELEIKKTDFIQTSSWKYVFWAFEDTDKLMLTKLKLIENSLVVDLTPCLM